jgi:hypothetical protein
MLYLRCARYARAARLDVFYIHSATRLSFALSAPLSSADAAFRAPKHDMTYERFVP